MRQGDYFMSNRDIAHKEIDLRNWRSNQKNSGFLPQERAWLSEVFQELGFVDVFRHINPEPDQYTWSSNRARRGRRTSVGVDYQVATPGIAAKANAVSIYKTGRFSDHSPLIIDYDYNLIRFPRRFSHHLPNIRTVFSETAGKAYTFGTCGKSMLAALGPLCHK